MDRAESGLLCLQGGNELTPDCRPMDAQLLGLATPGRVVVVPLASEPGSDYTRTSDNGVRYFRALGADVVAAPDARRDAQAAADALAEATVVFLTGGSPRRLRDALVATGMAERIRERWHAGAMVVGSSAGAMVACAVTLLPKWRGRPGAGPGLGLVDGYVVVPHFDGRRPQWVQVALSVAPAVLGIPECSGVVIDHGQVRAVGVSASTLITADRREELPVG